MLGSPWSTVEEIIWRDYVHLEWLFFCWQNQLLVLLGRVHSVDPKDFLLYEGKIPITREVWVHSLWAVSVSRSHTIVWFLFCPVHPSLKRCSSFTFSGMSLIWQEHWTNIVCPFASYSLMLHQHLCSVGTQFMDAEDRDPQLAKVENVLYGDVW